MNERNFFHISKSALVVGTVLTNGLYGKKIRAPAFRSQNYPQYIKEEIFEEIRASMFPSRPSRMNCVFLLPDLDSAKFYRSNWNRYKSYIYEITVEGGEPFIVDMDLLNCNGLEYGVMKSCAEKYWGQMRHPESCTLEAILDGKAVVKTEISVPSVIW